jgi:hypothetical protein
MITTIPPRLRAPFRILAVGVVIVVVAVAGHGWGPPVYTVLIPFVFVVAAGLLRVGWTGQRHRGRGPP